MWLVAAGLVATSAVSFCIGRHYGESDYEQAYKAACMFSDVIRLEYDVLDDDEKCCTYTAYSALEEWCCDDGVNTDSLLNKYVWCY